MYAKFFGLRQDPFSIAPDPRYLFMSERHREALAHLLYGLNGGGGFVLLSGEIGTGKTTVCRCFLEQIPADCNVAYIFNPKLTARELLRSICDEFHITLPDSAVSSKELIDPLNAFLLREHAANRNNVLIIDEAQNLSSGVLEQLRLLTNLETNQRKLLQIVLIGQPELRRMLARPELEQLAQRVIARCHLDALSPLETTDYVAHRLAVAGHVGASPFDAKAIARVHKLARGVPRRINLLAGRALLGAFANRQAQVDVKTVDKAALEVFGPDLSGVGRADQRADRRAASGPVSRSVSGGVLGIWPAITLVLAGLLVSAALIGGAVLLIEWRAGRVAISSAVKAPLAPAASTAASTDTSAGTSVGTSAAPAALPASQALPPSKALTPGAASATATAAPGAASATPERVLATASEWAAALAGGPRTANQAWQQLARQWGVAFTPADSAADACQVTARQQVLCFSARSLPLALIRALNRPGVITLLDAQQRPVLAELTGLTANTASLQIGSKTVTVSLTTLAERWRGDFATLRRVPAGFGGAGNAAVAANTLPNSAWLAAQLARVQGSTSQGTQPAAPGADLRGRINAFQLAHDLSPDGVAGPVTLMQLNRATGVSEPELLKTAALAATPTPTLTPTPALIPTPAAPQIER